MTYEEFIKIINDNPNLTTHGNGVDDGTPQAFATERASLFNLYDEAKMCEEFLSKCKRTVLPQKSVGTTYRIKHLVEQYTMREYDKPMYIPEGALHVAATHLGFVSKPAGDTTSVYLNISSKTKIQDRWLNCF
jgi:hypothetical protein